MSYYIKLFGSLLDSTIWRADDEVRLVWITMMAMADREGVVEASVPGLADRARVSLEGCRKALAVLEGPDEWSRSKEHGGRRVEVVDGGWRLLNYVKYRQKMSKEEVREKAAIRKASERKRKAGGKPMGGEEAWVRDGVEMQEHVVG